jgi:sporulation protein YlmC with PRC-barrel domain
MLAFASPQETDMSYMERDTYGIYAKHKKGPGPNLMGAHTLLGEEVYNHKDEHLGEIKEIMLDMRSGQVAYAVLAFGGIFGMGEALFAVPWSALVLDTANKRFLLRVDKERLKDAPGFDRNNWPDMADIEWSNEVHTFYGAEPAYDRAL